MSKVCRKSCMRLIIVFLLMGTVLWAQPKGQIVGTVVDSQTGEALIGANIYLESTTLGAASDLDGRYVILNVPEGTYTLVVSIVGYTETKVNDLEVRAGEVSKYDIPVQPEILTTDVVVVEAKALENTEAALLKSRQKAIAVSDAISAEAISRTGSSDAADAMKQVVGASVVDGKYVYVRGLGERYSATQLNGAELPSSDPDKKAFQLDLLPANLLENITTVKTFTPDKPGNFSGGIVDVGTKNFPEKFTFKASFGSSFNSQTTGKSGFMTYPGGDRDWLGFDDGTREIPSAVKDAQDVINTSGTVLRLKARRDFELAQEVDSYTKSFNNAMSYNTMTAPSNKSLSISVGNEIKTGKTSRFGYLASLTYGRSFSFYDDGKVGRYSLPDIESETLNPELLMNDSRATAEATLGGLFTFAYNFNPAQQISGNVFYSNSGISESRFQQGKWPHQFGMDDPRTYYNSVLGYKERNVQSYQLRGEHFVKPMLGMKFDWSASFAETKQDEPDLRFVFYNDIPDNGEYSYNIVGSNFDDPARYFRYLDDNSNTYTLNAELPFKQWSGYKGKFKMGGYYQSMDREFNERWFTYHIANNSIFNEVDGDVNALFDESYLGIIDFDPADSTYSLGNLIVDNSRIKNNYTGDQEILAYYGMLELPVLRNLNFIGGVRVEKTDMTVASRDTTREPGLIDKSDVLPSLNLVYQVRPNMNLRFATTRTLARPNFREKATFSAKEFINGVELQGNPDLKRTLIDNYDLRLEWFMRPGEIAAASVFYKELNNPIEIGFAEGSTFANQIVTYTNVDLAKIKGLEFEFRSRLDHIHSMFSNLTIGANLSLIDSDIDIPQDELQSRLSVDSTASRTRDLQGQSEFILNMDLSYTNPEWGTTANLHFNTFSERLSKVTAGTNPDVYEQPAPKLDLNISQELLYNLSLKIGIKNILDSTHKQVYKYNGEEYTYLSYNRGVTYSVGLSYSL